MAARLGAIAVTSLAVIAFACADASAAEVRRRFDPDDLQFDPAGEMHMDLAFGAMRGESGQRWLAPDFDIDFAVTETVILGLDGAITNDVTPYAPYTFDRLRAENLWANSKVRLFDSVDDMALTSTSAGLQLGPRFPTAPGNRGAGFQALGLAGRKIGHTSGVINLGGMIDSGDSIARGRPVAVLAGFDLVAALGETGLLSLMADLSGTFFFSGEKHQLATTFGPVVAAAPWLDISLNALVGFLGGGDHLGAYVQLTPKVALF